MELRHDVVFKRNINGYVEEARVQLWFTHVRQIPMWVVYHPHNEEHEPRKAAAHGLYFLNVISILRYIERFYQAFQMDTEYVVLQELCSDALDALRKSKPAQDGLMYRVVYNNPMAELPLCAIGQGLYDLDEPRLVNAETDDIGRWCIYNLGTARAVALMNSNSPFNSYLNDRLWANPFGGQFLIQATPYNADGNPKEGEGWTVIDEFPHYTSQPKLDFTGDLSSIEPVFEIDAG